MMPDGVRAGARFYSRPRLALFVVGTATGLLVTSGDPGIDTLHRLQVTHSLWTEVPPVRPEEYPDFGIPGRGGSIHAWYGIGQSLIMLPADVVATLALRTVRAPEALKTKARPVLVCLMTFPLLAGLTLVFAFSLLTSLGFSENIAVLGALTLQFATGHLAYTQIHQENSLLVLLVTGGLALTVAPSAQTNTKHLLLGMQLAAAALLVRLSAVLDFACVAIVAVLTRATKTGGRVRISRGHEVAGAAVASVGLYLALDRMYHWLRFGEFTTTYIHLYGEHARLLNPSLSEKYPFVTPFAEGFLGPFLSPQRSMFLLEPLLVLAAIVTAARWRRSGHVFKVLTSSLAGLLVAQVCFYATYYDWSGAAAWGDRFVTVPLHLLGALGVAAALSQWESFGRLARRAISVVIAGAIGIQLASVCLWYNLEEAQAIHWQRAVLMPWQRFVNLAAVVLGRFDVWELSYPGFTERSVRPNFLPFLAEGYLSRNMAWGFKALWLTAVLGLLVLVSQVSWHSWRAHQSALRPEA